MPERLSTAVIIGGGMAGLLTARVLSDHCNHVTILERDHFVDAPVPRSGVPQASHSHSLLTRGQQLFEEFFPGILNEVVATGARVIDHVNDRRRLVSYGWQPRFPSELRMLLVSRATLELYVRRRVLAIPNVSLEQGVQVDELLADGRKIVGASLADSESDQVREIFADLIVDASGRSSNTPEWLENLNCGKVEEQLVDAKWAYASRFFKHPDKWPHDWLNTIMWPQLRRSDAQRTRGGILSPLEGNRCMVTLVGNSGDFPPRDEAGFLAFAESLISPVIADFIKSSLPVSPITFSRSTGNRWRRYDRLVGMPDNFVVIGDAVAAFNPVYAQGMSCAALEAKELGTELGAWLALGQDLAGFSKLVQEKIVASGNFAWAMSTQSDSAIEGVIGIQPPSQAALAYYERAMALGSIDPHFVVNCEKMANLVGDNKWMVDPDVEQLVIDNWDRLGAAAGAPQWPAPKIGQRASHRQPEGHQVG